MRHQGPGLALTAQLLHTVAKPTTSSNLCAWWALGHTCSLQVTQLSLQMLQEQDFFRSDFQSCFSADLRRYLSSMYAREMELGSYIAPSLLLVQHS